MQKICIMTDSACDLPADLAQMLGIRVMPIPFFHNGKTYSEQIDFTNEEFYDLLLSSNEIPTTAHITANTYLEEYTKVYEQGFTHLLNITINSLGSGIFGAASLAKEAFFSENASAADKFRIEVVDSKTYTMAYGIAALKAARMAQQDADFDEIILFLNDWFDRAEVLFSVYSLDFVKKSGRVSCAAAFVGDLLGLRPMILFTDGVANIVEKVRGDKNVLPGLLRIAEKRMRSAENHPFVIVRGTPVKQAEELEAMIREKMPGQKIDGVFPVGASISINSGPKVVALVYAGEKRTKQK